MSKKKTDVKEQHAKRKDMGKDSLQSEEHFRVVDIMKQIAALASGKKTIPSYLLTQVNKYAVGIYNDLDKLTIEDFLKYVFDYSLRMIEPRAPELLAPFLKLPVSLHNIDPKTIRNLTPQDLTKRVLEDTFEHNIDAKTVFALPLEDLFKLIPDGVLYHFFLMFFVLNFHKYQKSSDLNDPNLPPLQALLTMFLRAAKDPQDTKHAQVTLALATLLRAVNLLVAWKKQYNNSIWKEAYAIGFLQGKLNLINPLSDPELKEAHRAELSRQSRKNGWKELGDLKKEAATLAEEEWKKGSTLNHVEMAPKILRKLKKLYPDQCSQYNVTAKTVQQWIKGVAADHGHLKGDPRKKDKPSQQSTSVKPDPTKTS